MFRRSFRFVEKKFFRAGGKAMSSSQKAIWQDLHDQAVKEGKTFYKDPATGYNVFTSAAHQKRGYCCGGGCRHCPFGHINVKKKGVQSISYDSTKQNTTKNEKSFTIQNDTNNTNEWKPPEW